MQIEEHIKTKRIGIVGTGFIARGLTVLLDQQGYALSRVLTRRSIESCTDFPRQDLLTNAAEDLVEQSDLVFECSGDPIHATAVVDQAMQAGRPVVTMDAEFHVTTGSYFVGRGVLTEAEGDQPGCLAAHKKQVVEMGFTPLVYGNIKGFLNHHPTRKDMEYWSKKQGISLQQVTAFTDGTKVQIEQAFVANGLGAGIAQTGLLGVSCEQLDTGAKILANHAHRLNQPLSDYVLSAKSPPGVFIVAEHDPSAWPALRYMKLGEAPFYVLLRPYHLCHLEALRTINQVLRGEGILMDNSSKPSISVAAIAKRTMKPGTRLSRGMGSMDVRGEAIRIADHPDHVPIGLLAHAVVKRKVELDQPLTFDDVELPEHLALKAWLHIRGQVLHAPAAVVRKLHPDDGAKRSSA